MSSLRLAMMLSLAETGPPPNNSSSSNNNQSNSSNGNSNNNNSKNSQSGNANSHNNQLHGNSSTANTNLHNNNHHHATDDDMTSNHPSSKRRKRDKRRRKKNSSTTTTTTTKKNKNKNNNASPPSESEDMETNNDVGRRGRPGRRKKGTHKNHRNRIKRKKNTTKQSKRRSNIHNHHDEDDEDALDLTEDDTRNTTSRKEDGAEEEGELELHPNTTHQNPKTTTKKRRKRFTMHISSPTNANTNSEANTTTTSTSGMHSISSPTPPSSTKRKRKRKRLSSHSHEDNDDTAHIMNPSSSSSTAAAASVMKPPYIGTAPTMSEDYSDDNDSSGNYTDTDHNDVDDEDDDDILEVDESIDDSNLSDEEEDEEEHDDDDDDDESNSSSSGVTQDTTQGNRLHRASTHHRHKRRSNVHGLEEDEDMKGVFDTEISSGEEDSDPDTTYSHHQQQQQQQQHYGNNVDRTNNITNVTPLPSTTTPSSTSHLSSTATSGSIPSSQQPQPQPTAVSSSSSFRHKVKSSSSKQRLKGSKKGKSYDANITTTAHGKLHKKKKKGSSKHHHLKQSSSSYTTPITTTSSDHHHQHQHQHQHHDDDNEDDADSSSSSSSSSSESESSTSSSSEQRTVQDPSKSVIQWVLGMSQGKQRRKIAAGMRVKVRFEIKSKKRGKDGNLIRKYNWYGGIVTKVGNGGKKIRIKYDDGTSEVTHFPDKEIVVDAEGNGRHEVPADAFLPKSLPIPLVVSRPSSTITTPPIVTAPITVTAPTVPIGAGVTSTNSTSSNVIGSGGDNKNIASNNVNTGLDTNASGTINLGKTDIMDSTGSNQTAYDAKDGKDVINESQKIEDKQEVLLSTKEGGKGLHHAGTTEVMNKKDAISSLPKRKDGPMSTATSPPMATDELSADHTKNTILGNSKEKSLTSPKGENITSSTAISTVPLTSSMSPNQQATSTSLNATKSRRQSPYTITPNEQNTPDLFTSSTNSKAQKKETEPSKPLTISLSTGDRKSNNDSASNDTKKGTKEKSTHRPEGTTIRIKIPNKDREINASKTESSSSKDISSSNSSINTKSTPSKKEENSIGTGIRKGISENAKQHTTTTKEVENSESTRQPNLNLHLTKNNKNKNHNYGEAVSQNSLESTQTTKENLPSSKKESNSTTDPTAIQASKGETSDPPTLPGQKNERMAILPSRSVDEGSSGEDAALTHLSSRRKKSKGKPKKKGKGKGRGRGKNNSEEAENWVQCNTCQKWRWLPSDVDVSKLPDIWVCALNIYDEKRNNCDAPEQTTDEVAKERKSKRMNAASASRSPVTVQKGNGTPSDCRRRNVEGKLSNSEKATSTRRTCSPVTDMNNLNHMGKSVTNEICQETNTEEEAGLMGDNDGAGSDNTVASALPSQRAGKGARRNRRNKDEEKEKKGKKGKKQKESENQEWVQCDICEKWRRLPPFVKAKDLPDKWTCDMNTWDSRSNSCAIQDDYGSVEEPSNNRIVGGGGQGDGSSNKLSYKNLIRPTRQIAERTRAEHSLFSSLVIDPSAPPTVLYAKSSAFQQRHRSNEEREERVSLFQYMKNSQLWKDLLFDNLQSECTSDATNLEGITDMNTESASQAFSNEENTRSMKAMVHHVLGIKEMAAHEVLFECQCSEWDDIKLMELRASCTLESIVHALNLLMDDGIVEVLPSTNVSYFENSAPTYRRKIFDQEGIPGQKKAPMKKRRIFS